MPNITFKKSHMKIFKVIAWQLKWSLSYPTPLLNVVSKKGIGGFIDPSITIPQMLGLSISLIMSRPILSTDVSLNAGVDIGLVFNDLDERANIELPHCIID